ncbi:MAG: hypothetical protein QOH24_1939 [Verrucomicrobiota bacterium]|jgi:hypothetical protein
MKKSGLAVLLFLFATLLRAGPPQEVVVTQTTAPVATPIDIVELESGYVFESDLNHGGSKGKQDEIQNNIEYAHRFLLSGNLYLHVGVAYSRFDFDGTRAPVPNHLQSAAGVIGLDYMQGANLGAFIQVRPGFYGENNFDSSTFDVPWLVGRFFTLQPRKFYVLIGAGGAFLRGTPVYPLVGIVYIWNEQWQLKAIPPEPRLIYSPTKKLDLWIGGELAGGSYRIDQHDEFFGPHITKLRNAQVDFTDYRAGVGLTYEVSKNLDVDLGGGCSIERQFAYHRAGENFRTDPSPYVRIEIKAHF